jgi:hypothetical protein
VRLHALEQCRLYSLAELVQAQDGRTAGTRQVLGGRLVPPWALVFFKKKVS